MSIVRAVGRESLRTVQETGSDRNRQAWQAEHVHRVTKRMSARRACARQVLRGNVPKEELRELLDMLGLDITPLGVKQRSARRKP